jgi:hypothetical protein
MNRGDAPCGLSNSSDSACATAAAAALAASLCAATSAAVLHSSSRTYTSSCCGKAEGACKMRLQSTNAASCKAMHVLLEHSCVHHRAP